LGGVPGDVSEISQRIVVPAGSGPALLHYRYQIESAETNCNIPIPSDTLTLWVDNLPVESTVICSAFNTPTWVTSDFATNFAAYAGQTVAVTLRLTNDGVLPSSVFLDSLSFSSIPLALGAENARRLATESGPFLSRGAAVGARTSG
jgi:hypothetical protein